MTTSPEQQLAECLSSSHFVVRCCHCCWSPGQRQTFPLSSAFCCTTAVIMPSLSPHKVQAQSVRSVFETNPVAQGLCMNQTIDPCSGTGAPWKNTKKALFCLALYEVKSYLANSHFTPPITHPGLNLERTWGKEKLRFCMQAEKTLNSNRLVSDWQNQSGDMAGLWTPTVLVLFLGVQAPWEPVHVNNEYTNSSNARHFLALKCTGCLVLTAPCTKIAAWWCLCLW